MENTSIQRRKVALVTGAARRIGAHITRSLHRAGYCTVLHYGGSAEQAAALTEELNAEAHDTATTFAADLRQRDSVMSLAKAAISRWGRIDLLVNNASAFYPTAIGETEWEQWDELVGVNLKAPFFLGQALAAELRNRRGAIINITDIYAERPLAGHSVYCASKAGLLSLTRSMALDLAPEVRVNAIAPGAILWPENDSASDRQALVRQVPQQSLGQPDDIARAVLFLALEAGYITGQVINVDGGRSIVP